MRHVSRTHRVALDWLFDRINLDPMVQIKYVDTKHQLADILTKGNFTRDEWNSLLHLFNISHFGLLCCSQNFSLTSSTKTMAKRMQGQAGSWQSQSRRRWTWLSLSRQVLRLCRIQLRRKARGYSKHPVEQIGQVQGNMTQKKTQWRRSVEFTGMAKRCSSGCRYEETRRDRRRPGTRELSWRFTKYEETRRFRKLRNRRRWRNLAAQSPKINKLRAAHGEGFLDRARRIKWRTSMWTQVYGYIHVCHTSSCSSSWLRLHRKFAIFQESTQEIFETVISSDWEVDHGSDRKILDWPRLTGSSLLCWQTELFSLQLQKPTSFLSQCYVWEVSVLNQSKHGKARSNGFWKHVISKIWIGSDNFPRIHCVGNSWRDPQDDDWIKVWTWPVRRKDHLHVNVQRHWLLCILDIGVMKSGRASWQEEEETRTYFSIVVIIHEKFFTSELFKVIQDAILLISFITGQCLDSGRFLQVHLSRWMCNQFTCHHQFRIDTRRSKFEQKTDSILSAYESFG